MKKLRTAVFIIPIICGCSFVVDLLHMEAVEVVAWSPNRESIPAGQVSCITVTFSNSMNKVLGEDAFTLSRDTKRLHGHFSWQGKDTVLVFLPEVPLADGHRYTLEVTDSAEDVYGNSLAGPFHFEFSTAEELVPPEVLLHQPEDGAMILSVREPVCIVFSEPIDEASFFSSFSFFPSINGGFVWSGGGEEVRFVPLADYLPGETYEVVLAGGISDRSGNTMAKEFRFNFHVSEISEPSVVAVEAVGGGKPLVPIQSGGGLDPSLYIEKDEQFLITFTGALDNKQIIDLIGVDPFTPFSLTWNQDNDACVLSFGEILRWNQVYSFGVLGLTYTFVVNGPQSIPITVAAVTYCPDLDASPGGDKFVLLQFADNIDFSGAVKPAFDFHLELAVDQQVDIGSFLEALDVVVVPDCIDLTLRDVEVSPLTVAPYSIPQAGQSVVRVHCSVVENPAVTGTVLFRLSTLLQDTADNHLSEEFVLLVNNN